MNYHKIEELQNQKDITILYGGKGGYNRPTVSWCNLNIHNQSSFVSLKLYWCQIWYFQHIHKYSNNTKCIQYQNTKLKYHLLYVHERITE